MLEITRIRNNIQMKHSTLLGKRDMSNSDKVRSVQSTLDYLVTLSDEAAASHTLAHSLSMVSLTS